MRGPIYLDAGSIFPEHTPRFELFCRRIDAEPLGESSGILTCPRGRIVRYTGSDGGMLGSSRGVMNMTIPHQQEPLT